MNLLTIVDECSYVRSLPPGDVSSTAKGKDFALSVGDLTGDTGGVVLAVISSFRGLTTPSRLTASFPDAIDFSVL